MENLKLIGIHQRKLETIFDEINMKKYLIIIENLIPKLKKELKINKDIKTKGNTVNLKQV
jgi:hypothetical protein